MHYEKKSRLQYKDSLKQQEIDKSQSSISTITHMMKKYFKYKFVQYWKQGSHRKKILLFISELGKKNRRTVENTITLSVIISGMAFY